MMAFSYDTMPTSVPLPNHSFAAHVYTPTTAPCLRLFIPPLVFIRRLDSLRVWVSGIVLELVGYI
jgi:hypothetical protein